MNDIFMYTAGAKGLIQPGDFSLNDYINQLPMRQGDTLTGACDGQVIDLDNAPDSWTAYCDSTLDGREFTQG